MPLNTRVHAQRFLLPLILLPFVAGCTKQSGGVIDPNGVPAFISAAKVVPDTVRMKSLPQVNGVLTVSIAVRAHFLRPSGSAELSSVSAAIIPAGATDPLFTVSLHDDGTSGDSVAGDGTYSALVQFTVSTSASGVFRARISATDQLGYSSNTVEAPFVMLRDNHPPVISNLVAPDTVTIPAAGTTDFQLSVRATDQDGQTDITQVYFLSLDSSNPTQRYLLKNDGSAPGSVPGDSIYAITVQATSAQAGKTYRLSFEAVDSFGDTSGTLLHSITLR